MCYCKDNWGIRPMRYDDNAEQPGTTGYIFPTWEDAARAALHVITENPMRYDDVLIEKCSLHYHDTTVMRERRKS